MSYAKTIVLSLVPFLVLPCLGAQRQSLNSPQLVDALPSSLERHAVALGDRVRVPGKERAVYSAVLTDERGVGNPVRVVVQLPGIVRLEGMRGERHSVVFDGENTAPGSRIEEQLLEAFSSDNAEGMLAAIKAGAAVELLGRRVRDGSSKRFDVFEVSARVRSRTASPEQLKRYYFDSETGLLSKTEYADDAYSPPLTVETRFSEWRSESGSTYPGRIERLENSRTVFDLTITSIVALPRQDPSRLTDMPVTGSQEE
jgi:hypothetical protein